jgi:ribonuclease HI
MTAAAPPYFYYVECCYIHSFTEFWMPVLKTGLSARDLSQSIKQMLLDEVPEGAKLKCVPDVYVAHHTTHLPFSGKTVILPGQAVRIWVLPQGAPKPFHSVRATATRTEAAVTAAPDSYREYMSWLMGPAFNEILSGTSSEDDQDYDDDMPFYAVRAGHTTGIFLTKSDMLRQTQGYANAECKMFAALEEANLYLTFQDERAVCERSLMSSGSRARHPPKTSASFLVTEEEDVSNEDDGTSMTTSVENAVAPRPSVHVVDVFWDCMLNPLSKTGYVGIGMTKPALTFRYVTLTDVKDAGRCELAAAKLALEHCLAQPNIEPTTIVRIYSSSTYATNAINKYARIIDATSRQNSDLMSDIAGMLRVHKIMAYWTSTVDANLQSLRSNLIKFKLAEEK